jgi:alpha-methylacyl-CoA racemase
MISMVGVLDGVRVIELAGLGPAPFAGMLLADLGADVVRIDRDASPGMFGHPRHDLLGRGKRSVIVDLKQPRGVDLTLQLVERADVLIEGYRPGVTERLGLGPQRCHEVNPRLVYGRMTGWGQEGPLAPTAGHDLAYIALTGALHAIGPAGTPVPPINLLGDFGGGGMLLVVGVLAALWRAERTGAGEVVDASIVDGAALLSTMVFGLLHGGLWRDERAVNLLDGGAPNYGVYATADGKHLAVGPLEAKFWAAFVAGLGEDPGNPYDPAQWPAVRQRVAELLAQRPRDEWLAIFDGTDACVAPVLTLGEAAAGQHPHLAARQTFVEAHGVRQPAPAPRFAGAPATLGGPPPLPGEHTASALADWGIDDVDALLADGVVQASR